MDCWIKYNITIISSAVQALGKIKLYKFEKEDKDKFIDAYKTLLDLQNKYRE